MQSVEVSGKTLDEAKKVASKQLGVDVGSLAVTVLEESKGLFGRSSVKIKAEAKEASAVVASEPEEKKPPRKRAAKAPKAVVEPEASEPEVEITTRVLAEQSEEGETSGPEATQQDADQLGALVEEALDRSGLDVTVKVQGFQGRYVNIEMDGRDAAFLIGKHGEVLNALQYLVNIMAGRKFQNGIRATLDGANYRRRREEALTGLAQKIADQVKKRGEEAVLDALPAFERRIVHKALADNRDVSTYSEGEEPNRRVVIAPAD